MLSPIAACLRSLAYLPGGMPLEGGDTHRRQRNGPARCPSLGWDESQFSPDALKCVHHLQVRVPPRIDFQVNILPAQAQQLRTAKTQVQGGWKRCTLLT
jgi:hypothetical protein